MKKLTDYPTENLSIFEKIELRFKLFADYIPYSLYRILEPNAVGYDMNFDQWLIFHGYDNLVLDTEPGYAKGERCNRGGCDGIIDEYESDSCCSCHICAPCSYCENSREYCPNCGWNGREEQIEAQKAYQPTEEQKAYWKKQQDEWDSARTLFYQKYNGKHPIDKLEMRTESHTHFSQKVFGFFPKGSETAESLLPKVRGTFGGRFTRLSDTHFEYIAYTD